MSRSRRKTPICGIACAPSDKPFKVAEHRRERRALRQASDIEGFKGDYGNPWDSPKDGKKMFDPKRWPKGMRK